MSETHHPKKVPPVVEQPGFLLVVSGPSGVGKDTVWRAAAPHLPTFAKAVTCTTRPRRESEQEGVHYYFVTDEQFDRLIHEDALLEWAHVHGYRYGVPVASVLNRINNEQDVVCVIDVQGAQRIRALFPTASLVFIKPPPGRETTVLQHRIEQRGITDAEELSRRLRNAVWEMSHIPLYDYQIVNDEVEHAATELCRIVAEEKAKRAERAKKARPPHNHHHHGHGHAEHDHAEHGHTAAHDHEGEAQPAPA